MYAPAYAPVYYTPAYFSSGGEPPTNQISGEATILVIVLVLGFSFFVCLVVSGRSGRRTQERALQNVIETPQRRQGAVQTVTVANEFRESDEEALKRRQLILMTLFPMEGKVRIVSCFVLDASGRFPCEKHI